MKKKQLSFLIRFIVLVASILLLLRIIDPEKLWATVKTVPPLILVFATITGFVRNWFLAVRWKILNIDTSGKLTTWDYFRFSLIGGLFNIILPGSFGGDVVKTALIADEVEQDRSKNIMSVVFDRLVGLISILFLGIIMLNLSSIQINKTWINVSVVLLFATGTGLLFIVRKYDPAELSFFSNKKGKIFVFVLKIFSVIHESVNFYIKYPQKIIKAFLICFLVHLSWFFIVYLFAVGLNLNLTFADVAMSTTMVWIITAIPLSIGGLGIREISHVIILSKFGIVAEKAVSLSLYQFTLIVIIALVGIPFLLVKKDVNSAP